MAHRELIPNTQTTHRRSIPRPEAQIRLLFERFQAFVDEYRPKISLGGVFIATAQPKPVGTIISCEFRLADGFRLCQVLGEVLWVRPQATAPDRPAGMGIRFEAIDDEGRKLILKILEEQVKTGGEPFEVERLPADVLTSAGTRLPEPGEDPESTHRRSPPVPMPREDPASTYTRQAVTPAERVEQGAGSAPGVDQVEPPAPAPGSAPAAAEQPFDAVQPLDDFIVEPMAPEEPADFNAPWGVELPGIPEDVIEPLDEEEVMESFDDDFAVEVDFSSAGDAEHFELDASAEDPVLDGLPDFEVIEEESLDSPPEVGSPGILDGPRVLPERRVAADFPEFDEPLGPEPLAPGPSLAGLDDTLPRSLPDDGPELGMAPPSTAGTSVAAPSHREDVSYREDVLSEPPPVLSDVDEPLTAADGEMSFEDWSPGPPDLGTGLDDDLASEPSSGLVLGPAESAAMSDVDSSDDSWWDSDADDEWEEEAAESGVKGFWHDAQVTVAESKGRILTVVALLIAVGAGLVFREQVLGLVGLGSEGVPSQPAATERLPAGAEEGSPVEEEASEAADNPTVPEGAAAVEDESSRRYEASPADPDPAPEVPPSSTQAPFPPPPLQAETPPLAAGSAAARVQGIVCGQTPQGTRCVVTCDGQLAQHRFEHHSLGYDPLKEQIVLLGIEAPYRLQQIDVGTLELDRIRTGLAGDRLSLVFDLSSERMTLSSFESRGERLEIIVSRKR